MLRCTLAASVATVTYDGRSEYPGVDQIDVVVPQLGSTPAFETASLEGHATPRASGFQGGCGISVVVVANGIGKQFWNSAGQSGRRRLQLILSWESMGLRHRARLSGQSTVQVR